MLNPRLDRLGLYPFDRLRDLLADVSPPAHLRPFVLSVGEPRHAPPAFISRIVAEHAADWSRYPPLEGTPEWRAAVAGYLGRRYDLSDGAIDPDRHLLPVCGTREALFLVGALAVPARKSGRRPAVLMPNPFYQTYLAAAALSGADPVLLPATRDTGFLPDLEALDRDTLDRTAVMFLCSPANPQGAVADATYLRRAVELARHHGFVLVVDECYAEIYDGIPPPGTLAAAGGEFDNVLVFHSLSKRSSAPGLRSGFVAGNARLIAALRRLRSYGGATVPLPLLAASAALWRDDAHVEATRALYRAKMDAAAQRFGDSLGFYRPAGGFFLWLDVDDGERAARSLWTEGAVRVLPGAYLAQDQGGNDRNGANPGSRFIRVALIDDLQDTEEALDRIVKIVR